MDFPVIPAPAADEMGILGNQAGIVHQRDNVRRRDLPDLFEVAQREGLPAEQIGGSLHARQGDLVGVVGLDGTPDPWSYDDRPLGRR
jgi:hypothetical protein